MNVMKMQGKEASDAYGGKLRSQLTIDIFPSIPIEFLEQIFR